MQKYTFSQHLPLFAEIFFNKVINSDAPEKVNVRG